MNKIYKMKYEDVICIAARLCINGQITYDKMWDIFFKYIANSKMGPYMRSYLHSADWFSLKKERKLGRLPNNYEGDTLKHSAKENCLSNLFCYDFKFKTGSNVKAVDFGVDNTGRLVHERTENICLPDYLYIFDNFFGIINFNKKFDVKCAPIFDKATFKVSELHRLLEHDAWMLLFIGTGMYGEKSWEPRNSSWAILGENAIRSLLTLKKSNNYPGFGGKLCVIIGSGRIRHGCRSVKFEELFTTYPVGIEKQFEGVSNRYVDFRNS